jgi:hypothetical protein
MVVVVDILVVEDSFVEGTQFVEVDSPVVVAYHRIPVVEAYRNLAVVAYHRMELGLVAYRVHMVVVVVAYHVLPCKVAEVVYCSLPFVALAYRDRVPYVTFHDCCGCYQGRRIRLVHIVVSRIRVQTCRMQGRTFLHVKRLADPYLFFQNRLGCVD